MCFLWNLHKNPQEKLKILVMAELSTRRVGADPGLMPRLAGGGSAPALTEQLLINHFFKQKFSGKRHIFL